MTCTKSPSPKVKGTILQLTEQFFQLGVFIGKFSQGFLVLSQERKPRFERAATFFWRGLLSGFRMSVKNAGYFREGGYFRGGGGYFRVFCVSVKKEGYFR